MSDLQFREAVARVTRGQADIALSNVMVELLNAGQSVTAPEVERQLCILGFRREGFHGIGCDRTPRYMRGERL